ncbi:hypothetical protein B0H66DRAFT_375332 [Apodospora peruviana]|uniref:Uncharacterized protein n=1 Tax=Apodospora peruviana TaxID=516989 RepID=A0AAE0HWP2_9PEZI|nr:hypothetical protein B0H66DRAFT_375332 [Apodospora peruviana]
MPLHNTTLPLRPTNSPERQAADAAGSSDTLESAADRSSVTDTDQATWLLTGDLLDHPSMAGLPHAYPMLLHCQSIRDRRQLRRPRSLFPRETILPTLGTIPKTKGFLVVKDTHDCKANDIFVDIIDQLSVECHPRLWALWSPELRDKPFGPIDLIRFLLYQAIDTHPDSLFHVTDVISVAALDSVSKNSCLNRWIALLARVLRINEDPVVHIILDAGLIHHMYGIQGHGSPGSLQVWTTELLQRIATRVGEERVRFVVPAQCLDVGIVGAEHVVKLEPNRSRTRRHARVDRVETILRRRLRGDHEL